MECGGWGWVQVFVVIVPAEAPCGEETPLAGAASTLMQRSLFKAKMRYGLAAPQCGWTTGFSWEEVEPCQCSSLP